jgi:RHS repeat-associated protein
MVDRRAEDDPRRKPAPFAGAAANDKPKPAANGATGTGPAAPPVPSLPKGGGALRGIGEKFSANPVTGTGSLSVPIATSPGRAGFHPDLSLSYDSGAGNGPFGHGFHLSIPQITRKTDKGLPRYGDVNDADIFILSGAEDLVPKRLADANWQKERFADGADMVERYIPRVEGLFARIEKREMATGVVYWQATTRDNVTSTYGRSEGARIVHPSLPRLVFSWLLEETRDDRGNVILYEYKAEDLVNVPRAACSEANRHQGLAPIVNRYIKRIRYGNTIPFDATPALDSALFEVVFDYGEHALTTPTESEPQPQPWSCREDPFSTYRAGFEVRTYRLCRRVLMFHSMTEFGDAPCLVRSTDFSYTENPVLTQLASVTHTGYIRDPATLAYQKKSHPPVEFGYSIPQIQTRVEVIDRQSLADLRGGVQGLTHQWVDLDGEGLPGVLLQEAGTLFYKTNLGEGKLAPARRLPTRPSLASSGGLQLLDLDGDGRKEMVVFEPPVAGYHERTEEDGWAPFRPFASQPNIDWSDPNLRFIDLSGDGHEDVLMARDQTFLWYPSLAKGGFGEPITLHKLQDEEEGPALIFADGTQTLFLADMSGDGLTDLVRIRNGSVCYWPNLGYGRFGAKVQMEGEVWFDDRDQFDPRRIRLADVDGSGTTDILYIHRDGVRIYTNQSGNTVAKPIELPRFPDQSDLSTLSVLDLLGTGTGCLVWSSPLPGSMPGSIRYVDLLGSKKPYLLTSVKNNLGLETRMEYAPSTKFYRQDALARRPWVTRLPFPVQVLTRVETYDAVSRHRFVSTYAYHHGYFDGIEREFRGFGMVEQWDTESFSTFRGMGELPPPANATDPELHLPPVHTKTWFHTGAWFECDRISKHYAHEYYAGDADAALLPDTLLPSGLTADEAREACRALKGQILRQETYADDGSAQAPHPYLVSERSYAIRPLQPLRGKVHGVFFVHPREAIEYHYERNPDDPRITHAITLEVDAFGTVRRSAAVGYPRRVQPGLPAEQSKVAITLTEVDVVHQAPVGTSDGYRIGVPVEMRTYELTGLEPAPDAIFSFQNVLDAADEASKPSNPPLPYEGTPDPAKKQKRLLSQARTLYYSNDLSGPLPVGQIESLALPYQSYAKAFTPALIGDIFQGRATDAILAEGGYVKLAGDDAWWIPSGRQIPEPAAFYLPVTFLDPFGNATNVTYDAYSLMVTQAVDPVQNVVAASYDYRVLAPAEVTDPNGSRSQARFDELGRVVATAVMGKKAGPTEGDTLDEPTTTFDYDLDRYRQTGKPSVVHARAREQHGAANTRWQESYSYADGSGNEVMRKVQAEPGPAPQRDVTGALVHDAQGKLVLADTNPRWVGTGRTVLDNKGNPVKQYEPFFSATHEYEDEAELVEWGVTPILRYDPLGRLLRTDLPNGTFSKVVFDPWQETRFDPNDTVLESVWYQDRQGLDPIHDPEGRAAHLAAAHANTPAVVHLDALGRTFRTIEDNGPAGQYATTVTLDIEGSALTITDARDVVAMQHRFGMGGHKLWQKSCDAGEWWALADAGGAMLWALDERGFTRRAVYDEARRPTHLYVQPESGPELLVERIIYGEALGLAAATTLNHRGRVYQHYDGAGVVTSAGYDFKGNLLESDRRLAKEYHTQVDWKAIEGLAVPDVLASPTKDLLEAEVFSTSTAYDALNRPTSLITPDQSEIVPTYNEASLLEKVQVRIRGAAAWTTFVDDIAYDAKGQRESIVYGGVLDSNGVLGKRTTTAYTYDPLTFRLAHLKTTRELDGELLQSLSYAYDPVGNITEIKDGAQQKVFFNNDVVTPSTAYVYDAIYRLIQASGREQAGGLADVQRDQNDLPLMNLPHVNDMQAVRNYTESYEYDPVGNILGMAHDSGAAATSWTRRHDVDANSNRLLGTSMPGDQAGQFSGKYTYDTHGNMTSMPHLASVGWDYRDQLLSADKGGGGVVYFAYDAAGQRVRKVYEHHGLTEERIYLGGWEIYRKRQGGEVVLERETLHVTDGEWRIALVETKTTDTSVPAFQPSTVIRFQLGNHLGSAVLEVDEAGLVISYEEYHPYGTAAYCSRTGAAEVSRKRYRYTGKERDEESGLYYHGARYYAPWLGRWAAADPIGVQGGLNLYEYAAGNPVRLKDPNGHQPLNTHDPNVERLRKQGASDRDIQRLIALKPTAPRRGAGSGGSGGPGHPPKPRIDPSPPSPPNPPLAPPGPGRPGDANVPEGPGEHHGPGGKGAGNAEGDGTGTGPGSTLLDDAVFVQGMLGMQPPSDDGMSGGIPGGFGKKENASAAGQGSWLAVQLLWGKLVGGLKKLGAAAGLGRKAEEVTEKTLAREAGALEGTAARGAGGGSVHPSTPVGRVERGPMTVQTPGTNSPATIGGRDYTGHALDRMQQRGLVPSVVEDAITHGSPSPGRVAGTTAYYSSSNNVTVITDTASGRVITTYPGQGKGF